MRFLKWIFNFKDRHHKDIIRYEKNKLAGRIFILVLLFLMVGATLGLDYWFLNCLNQNILYAILVLLFLLIPVGLTSLEFLGVYAFIGFRMFFLGTAEKIAIKIDEKIASKSQVEDNTQAKISPINTQSPQNKYKYFDLFVGILSILLIIGLILALIFFPSLIK